MSQGISVRDLALLGVLALGGAVAYREFDLRRDGLAGNTAAAGQLGTPSSSAPAPRPTAQTDVATLLAEQQRIAQAQADALLRQQRIDTLRRDLSECQNDIDVEFAKATSIKGMQPDAAFVQAVTARAWQECRSSGPWISQAYRCNDGTVPPLAAAAVQREWAARIALQLQPIQAQLSRLNAKQISIVDNLRELGFAVPAAQIKKVTV